MHVMEQAYYLPETEYVHWARAHPVRRYALSCVVIPKFLTV